MVQLRQHFAQQGVQAVASGCPAFQRGQADSDKRANEHRRDGYHDSPNPVERLLDDNPQLVWSPDTTLAASGLPTSDPRRTVLAMHAPGVTVEILPRSNPRRRTELPCYAVKLNGRPIGRVQTKHLSGARNLFYFAYACHPDTGKEYRLEGNTDLEERVDAVRRFWLDPSTFAQHLGI